MKEIYDEIREMLVSRGYMEREEDNPAITIFMYPNGYGGYEKVKVKVDYVERFKQNSRKEGDR